MAEEQAEQAEQAQDSKVVVVEASTPVDKVPYEIELPEDAEGRVSASFNFAIGEDLMEDIEMYGEDTIRDLWLRQAVVKAQSAIRRELQNGTHPGDIPDQLNGWRPDITHTTSKDPKTSIKQDFKKLSAEERAELLALLEQEAAG